MFRRDTIIFTQVNNYTYKNSQVADILLGTNLILKWIADKTKVQYNLGLLVMGDNEVVYDYKDDPDNPNSPMSISFNEGSPLSAVINGNEDYGTDAHFAVGRAEVHNLKANAIVVQDNGMMCVEKIIVNGKITDVYDFNCYATGTLAPLLTIHAARVQLGYNSGLTDTLGVLPSKAGETFMNTFIFENKSVNLYEDAYDPDLGSTRNYKICY